MKPFFEKVPQRESSSFYAYYKEEPYFGFSLHYHPEYELTAIISGRGKRYIGESICEYDRLDIVMIPPEMPHSWQSPPEYGAARALVVQFTPDMLENIGLSLPEFAPIKKLLDRCSAGLSFGADEKTASLLRKTVHTGGLESLLSLIETLRHLSCLSSLPITVASASRPKNRQDCDNINRLFNYINENYTSPITLAGAAKIACKSESAFCRFFKQISGTTFMEHVNDLRVSLACRLLRETDKPITEICFEAGFSNIANFNRQFKKRKNQSPRQYRSENKHI